MLEKCARPTLEKVKQEVKSYMTYYNHFRRQWNLKRMMPTKYEGTEKVQEITKAIV